jgi:hypothetical protein
VNELIQQLALAGGLAWASGIRLYVVVFLVGLAQRMGWVSLPEALHPLSHDWVLGASAVMLVAEFLADKVPGFDSIWDAIHTFIRVPAGALLAAGAFGDQGTAAALAAGLIGGTITAGSHLTKAGTRAAINHSPEPVSNWLASFAEDLMAPAITWIAWAAPVFMLVLLLFFLLFAAWLLPKLWRVLRRLLRTLASLFSSRVPDQ